MSCWEILGIEQTCDLKAIKTAYAARAKEWHPEEHPEEFQRLQQAYRNAVSIAKLHQAKTNKTVQSVHTEAEPRYDVVRQQETKAEQEKFTSNASVNQEELIETAADKEEIIQEKLTRKTSAEKETLKREKEQEIEYVINIEGERNIGKQSQSFGYEDTEKQSQNHNHEDTGKQSQNFDYEEIREQSQRFDYEEIEGADLKERFFQEFFSIAWNPYLMNNLVCWEYILKRSPYDQLLSAPGFRRNFVLTVCRQLMGWQRGTILLFEKWLQSRPAKDAGKAQKKETDLICWKFRKIGLFGKIIPTQRCVTNEQKQLHEIFLAQVKRSGMDTSLKNEQDVECYLSFYLPYAAEKQSKIKQLYLGSCQGRTMLTTLLLMVPFFIGMVIYVQVSVVPQLNKSKAEEAERQRIEQKANEIRQYNELFQNGEYTEPEWVQEYYDELMQKGKTEHEAFLEEYYKLYPDRRAEAETTGEE